MKKTVAYIRVSTDRQDVENQRLEILSLANNKNLGKVKFVEEIISGRKSWRERELSALLSGLGKGDVLIVAELSRLGRSMLEIMEILSVATQTGIQIFAAKGNWTLDGSLQSKIVAMCFSMAAEIERDLISQRTKAALATKKAQGVRLGRPKGPGKSKLDDKADEIKELLTLGITRKRLSEKLDTTPANLRHWLKKRNLSHLGKDMSS